MNQPTPDSPHAGAQLVRAVGTEQFGTGVYWAWPVTGGYCVNIPDDGGPDTFVSAADFPLRFQIAAPRQQLKTPGLV